MIIDAHLHVSQGFQGQDGSTHRAFTVKDLFPYMEMYGLDGLVIFTHPEQIYTRPALNGPEISPELAMAANQYVADASFLSKGIFPFYFVPLDFAVPDNLDAYAGIKWHSDSFDPEYDYESQAFEDFLKLVKQERLPIILEEREDVTRRLVLSNPDIVWIIPHCGKCNGGMDRMKEYFGHQNVYFDISMCNWEEIMYFLKRVGAQRLIFGTDYSGTLEPYHNSPLVQRNELETALRRMGETKENAELILSGNILKLLRTL